MTASHQRYMQLALSLARRHIGITWPNPSVGAVLVRDGKIIGEGITGRGGRPHAETQAVAMAGDASGATLYVTLEPCSHHGKTPPCAEAIIKAGITTVVVACTDPNPLISGSGIALLRKGGITVIEHICEAEALDINRGFFSLVNKKRPYIALKIATSLDGKIATSGGESQWITGEPARNYVQSLRSQFDAIATGIGTVLADDPLLTCRLPGFEDRSPVRVVFDRKGRLPKDSKLAQSEAISPVWVLNSEIHASVQQLGERGITRLLVEAGGILSTAFLQSGLIDRIYWFRAPMLIGNDGIAGVQGGFSSALAQAPRYKILERLTLGSDSLEILECSPV